jgi:hypothetical protein
MCINHRQLDPKSRRLIRIAYLLFIPAILLLNSERWNWVHGLSQIEVNCLRAITGLLFGLYIAIMIFGLRSACRNRSAGSGEL